MGSKIAYDVIMAYDLPLFPLNTVLFPGMPLTLHIFEDRYKQMIEKCVQAREPFGVVLIRSGRESMGPLAEPHVVGCTAEIAQVQPLGEGRMNILAVGQDRFRIRQLNYDQPYLMGLVEDFPLSTQEPEATRVGRRLRPWIEKYLTLLSEVGDVEFDAEQIPDEPQTLAFLAATVLQIPDLQKQELLSIATTVDLLSTTRSLFRRELPLLRAMVQNEAQTPEGPGPFSLN